VRDAAQKQRDSPLSDGQEATEAWVGNEVPTANAAIAISARLASVKKQAFVVII
jgi:hypothetical protein